MKIPNAVSRRQFLGGIGSFAFASAFTIPGLNGFEPLYPPMDLSYFAVPIGRRSGEIHFGYAAITWGGNDSEAINDISALGFPGIQLRSNILKEFGQKPSSLRELLEQHHLALVALSSGDLNIENDESRELATHTSNAKFLGDMGGSYLQVICSRPKRAIGGDDYKRLAGMLTELGKRTADFGISLGYHNHMNSLVQSPDEVQRVFDSVDPRYAKLELDIAHYFAAKGDPASAIEKYHKALLFLHIKDVQMASGSEHSRDGYRFVELGRGEVDLPGVFAALKKVRFRGWAIVELDSVPEGGGSPKESAAISKKYLEEKLGYTI
ncbi:MAG: sugar phosphate isomerase/epimerase family protein [Terriglobales bacterium]